MSMQSPPPPRPTRSTIVLGVIAMQCGQKTRNCEEVLSFLVWREGGGWRIFEKKKRKKKISKFGGRERTRDEGEQETNKQTKKNRSPDLSVFSRHQPSFLREKRKKRHEMNHIRLHKLFLNTPPRARAYILSLFDTI